MSLPIPYLFLKYIIHWKMKNAYLATIFNIFVNLFTLPIHYVAYATSHCVSEYCNGGPPGV